MAVRREPKRASARVQRDHLLKAEIRRVHAEHFGVYGVPETFVIDRQGFVRYKHTGPMTPLVLQKEILPLLRRLEDA